MRNNLRKFCLVLALAFASMAANAKTEGASTTQKEIVRVMALNVAGLFQRFDKNGRSVAVNSKSQIRAKAETILAESPDVLILSETENRANLIWFATEYLKRQYTVHRLGTNDRTQLGIAMLVKKNRPWTTEYRSYLDRSFESMPGVFDAVFSRDFPVMILRRGNEPKPYLILAGVHSKSQRKTERTIGGRPFDVVLREKQEEEMVKIEKELESEFPGVPVIVGGDFQVDVRESTSLLKLKEQMAEAFTHQPSSATAYTATHYIPFRKRDYGIRTQPDSFFVSRNAIGRIYDVRVGEHFDCEGRLLPEPKDMQERNHERPSDHKPVILDFYLP